MAAGGPGRTVEARAPVSGGPRPGAWRREARAMTATGTRQGQESPRAGLWAHVGDRLIVGGATVGDEGRDGEIVGLHHVDGTPPFDVRWSDTGRVTLVFPGPDARVQHFPTHDATHDAKAATRS
ncbi:DUF1918 domain-containing protein [Streptomyces sp. NPDC017868]|uniref:DUF1918 domain-containing protein n=2 Tax=Streptomyces TaxID=1883 RepID=UPI0037B424A7